MQRLLNPTILIPALAGFLAGVVVNLVTETVLARGGPAVTAVIVAAALAVLVAAWLQTRYKPTAARFQTPITLRTPAERLTNARRGVIAFVSLYRPIDRNSPAQQLSSAEWVAAAQAGDYQTLDIERSNLATAVASITAHASKLEHCWLIATVAPNNSDQFGSLTFVPVLERYLREVKGVQCAFHTGEAYAVPLDDDALVAVKAHNLVNAIFKEARARGLQDTDVVADFTGCPRSMTLGLIAACLDRDRDIQFAGTRYDAEAQPIGPLFPVLFSLQAEVNEN